MREKSIGPDSPEGLAYTFGCGTKVCTRDKRNRKKVVEPWKGFDVVFAAVVVGVVTSRL